MARRQNVLGPFCLRMTWGQNVWGRFQDHTAMLPPLPSALETTQTHAPSAFRWPPAKSKRGMEMPCHGPSPKGYPHDDELSHTRQSRGSQNASLLDLCNACDWEWNSNNITRRTIYTLAIFKYMFLSTLGSSQRAPSKPTQTHLFCI